MQTIDILEGISNTEDGVFAADEDQRIVHWNAGAEKILGYSANDILGRLCFDVIKGVDQQSREVCYPGCPVIDCAKGGYPAPGREVKVKAKDGTGRWLSLTHTYLNRNDGNGNGRRLAVVVHIFRDATDGMEAKQTLKRISREVLPYGAPDAATEPVMHHYEGLTEREKQVAAMLAQGEGTSGIAKKLTISNATARNHIQNILVKLNVHTRLEAVAFMLRNRVLDDE